LRQTTEGQLKTRLDQAIKEAKELKNKGGLSLWEQCRILAQNLDTDKKVWREISWIPAIYDAPDIQTKLSSYFQDLAKVHRDTGVPVILIIAPALVDFTSYPLSPVHAFIHSLADKAKLPSCDLLDWFKKLGIKNVAFWGVDYMHLSPDGHQVVAAILQETLKPYKKSLENKEE
jgi:hypothetical protein